MINRKEIGSIPNILSYIRLLLIPVFIYVYFKMEDSSIHLFSTIILMISSITDYLDGYVARRYNMITALGKVLDPIADKFLQFVLAFVLMTTYPLFTIVTVILAIEDSLLLFFGFYIYDATSQHIDQAHLPGKVATFVFFLFAVILIFIDLSGEWISTVMILTIACLMAYATYFYGKWLWTYYKEELL